MHFEVLVEDQSGKEMLETLIPMIVGSDHTIRIIPYRGCGGIPKNLRSAQEASKRQLLNQLPKLLRGYGNCSNSGYKTAVVVVCDLDKKCLREFLEDLDGILEDCPKKPNVRFCIAIEEGEAWILGDIPAIKSAYPNAKDVILNSYINDSICDTWEHLADAIHKGGAAALLKEGWQAIGREKSQWAKKITPFMDIENNKSPSFAYFKKNLIELANEQ